MPPTDARSCGVGALNRCARRATSAAAGSPSHSQPHRGDRLPLPCLVSGRFQTDALNTSAAAVASLPHEISGTYERLFNGYGLSYH